MNRRLATTALILVLVIVGFKLYSYSQHRGLVKLTIYVLPADSQVKIDGVLTKGRSPYLKSGQHQITASRQDFTTDSQTVVLVTHKANRIYLAPTPSANAAWVKQNPKLELKREQYAQNTISANQASIYQNYSFIRQLPIETGHFSIRAGGSVKYPNDPAKIAVYIYADTPSYRQAALERLKNLGASLVDQEIVFGNLTNPFRVDVEQE